MKGWSKVIVLSLTALFVGIVCILWHYVFNVHTEVAGIVVLCIGLIMFMVNAIIRLVRRSY